MATPKTKSGFVKRVLTGSSIVLLGPTGNDGLPMEKNLFLCNVSAPRFTEALEEPLGFQAREFVRTKIAGKNIDFTTEYKQTTREFGRVFIGKDDLGQLLIEAGLAKVFVDVETRYKCPNFDQYQAAEAQAKKEKRGVWGDDIKGELRQAKTSQSPDYKADEILEVWKKESQQGIVEQYISGIYQVYLPKFNTIVNVVPAFIFTPILNQKHGQELRVFSEKIALSRDVTLKLLSFNDKTQQFVCDIKVGNVDLVNELLTHGWAKLTQNAVTESTTERFKELKSAMETAQNKGIRIWAEYKANKSTKKSLGSIYDGKVVEIHSGDSVSVEPVKGGEVTRLFFANIRAPAIGNPKKGEADKPWAYEAKEFVRKLLIGRKVRVEIEFSREFASKVEGEGQVTLVFGTLFLDEKNVSEIIVQNGWAKVNLPKLDEDFSKYLKQLTDAEEEAKKNKKGTNKAGEPPLHRINDITLQKNAQKIKQFTEFLKDEKKLQGVIVAVLSGTRFKVRLTNQNCYIVVNLHGIRTLPNDKNLPGYEKYANEAFKFSKDQALQRDAEIEVEHCDNRGLIHGNVIIQKKNLAALLLEVGLAHVHIVGKASVKNIDIYRTIEGAAKADKKGIWDGKVQLDFNSGAKKSTVYKALSSTQKAVVSDIVDATQFYLQDPTSKGLAEIEEALEQFDEEKQGRLEAPIKIGTPCVTQFDGLYNRAKVIRQYGTQDKYRVEFIDYGNTEDKEGKKLRKMPQQLLNIEAQAKQCRLAYLKVAPVSHDVGEDAAGYFREITWERKLQADLEYLDGQTYGVILYPLGQGDLTKSISALMIANGFARISKDEDIPEKYEVAWRPLEEQAKQKALGIWKYDDVLEDEDEAEDY